jgi:hypothetical protein
MCGRPPAVVKDGDKRSGFEVLADAYLNKFV